MSVSLATGPVSWGVDFADAETNPPWEPVLDEIGRSGYSYTELGPLGYLPKDAEHLRHELKRRGLEVSGSFIFEPLHERARLAEIIDVTRRTCELISGVGGRYLVVIDMVDPRRVATAGRSAHAERLGGRRHRALLAGISRVATLAREDFGLTPVLHPHVGTWIEFADEIDEVLAGIEPGLIELCLDTGHSAFAGMNPAALYRDHSDRVSYLHLKDVDPAVGWRVVREGLDFWAAIEAGVFCPLGEGMVDFEALGRELAAGGFDGPATVEQDRAPSARGSALEDVIQSREYLERVGISDREKARTR